MTINENEKENKNGSPRLRSARRDNLDLRKKVLKDQTSKILNQSPLRKAPEKQSVKSKPVKVIDKTGYATANVTVRTSSKLEEEEGITRVSCEEKTLQIRKRLEKVIHKKKNEKTAGDMLVMLQKMKFTPILLETTKICYTVEALKLVIKDTEIIKKADSTLAHLNAFNQTKPDKTSVNVSKPPVTELAKKVEGAVPKQPEAASYREWRDAKAKEKEKEREMLEEKKKDYEKRLKEFEAKEKRVAKKAERLEKNREKLLAREKDEHEVNVDADAEVLRTEEDDVVVTEGTGIKIGYWMDRLLEQVDNLNLLDKKIDNIEHSVKQLPPTESENKEDKQNKNTSHDSKKASSIKTKNVADAKDKKQLDEKRDRKENLEKSKKNVDEKKFDFFEDELLKITQSVQSINITEDSIETVIRQGDQTLIKTVKSDKLPATEILKKKKDASKKDNIPELPSKERLSHLKSTLENNQGVNHTKVIETLKELQNFKLTLAMLQETKVGIIVNNMRKNSDNPDVRDICKSLVLKWKKLTTNDSMKNNVESETKLVADKETRKEDIRDHCRKKLLSALLGAENMSDSLKVKAKDIASQLEDQIFAMFKEPNSKYRNQINSRFFNIRGNVSLQENILSGVLKVSQVASMTYEEMASDKVKEAREKWKEEALRSAESGEKHVADDFCTCRICLPPWIKN